MQEPASGAAAVSGAAAAPAAATASLSGLWPRLIGVLFKRIPKFGILLGYGVVTGDKSGKPGFGAATAASILSAPFINPVRMVEKQQRAYLKQTGPARGGRRRRHAHGQTGWLGRGRVEARVERRGMAAMPHHRGKLQH